MSGADLGRGSTGGQRVAVTGASGNLGLALVRRLAGDPAVAEVVGLARRPPEEPDTGSGTGAAVRWVAADVAHDDLDAAFAGCDAVVHLVWAIQPSHDPLAQWETNVLGSQRVFEAAQRAGAAVVHASSLAVYSAGPRDRPVGEDHRTDGVPSLVYSWQKAYVERLLDRLERDDPGFRVVRVRPSLVLGAEAASDVHRIFLGLPWPPALRPRLRASWLLRLSPLQVQITHRDDVADAIARAAVGDARGAFNLAAEPVVGQDRPRLAGVLRAAVAAAWHLRLSPLAPGWVDMARVAPAMSTDRARRELGWQPRYRADEALDELLAGWAQGEGGPTAALTGTTAGGLADDRGSGLAPVLR